MVIHHCKTDIHCFSFYIFSRNINFAVTPRHSGAKQASPTSDPRSEKEQRPNKGSSPGMKSRKRSWGMRLELAKLIGREVLEEELEEIASFQVMLPKKVSNTAKTKIKK